MKPFRFQKFVINQSKNVFRVGTDGVLLGALCDVSNAKKILEVGAGSGLISLMLAQRNSNAEIEAIDINAEAAELAEQNFRNSVFAERLKASLCDFKDFVPEIKFDVVVCNPPFFEENNSEKDVLARQQVELNFQYVVEKSSKILTENGLLSVIIPSEATTDFVKWAVGVRLCLVRKVNIYGIENGALKRNILEFSYTQSPLEIVDFTIEKSPRKYSDQYLELTKEFHVFKDSLVAE